MSGLSGLADDAVTLAKLAHGTADKHLGFDGAGVPAELPSPANEFWAPATGVSGAATRAVDGDYPVVLCNATGKAGHVSFFVPADFTSIIEAIAVIIPLETAGAANFTRTSDFAANGESKTANSQSDATGAFNITTNVFFEINIASILSGLAAGDRVGIKILIGGSFFELLGVRFKYV